MARPDELGSIIQRILDPTPDDAEGLLQEIGLGTIPSREQVHRKIDAKLLSPPDTLPDHWLSTYQMYGPLASEFIKFIILDADTGNLNLPYPLYFRSNPRLRLPA